MDNSIFREYDIRGVVDKDMHDADVTTLGRAMATFMNQRGIKRITLGRDCRLSSDRYRDLLLQGLLDGGLEVLDIGVCPTPLLYYSVWHYKSEGAVMITASHNPPEYNGFKIMTGKQSVYGEGIQELGRIAQGGQFSKGQGKVSQAEVIGPYMDEVAGIIKLSGPLKWAADCGNGTAGPVAIPLMRRLGIEVIPLYDTMDGSFPNHEPDPTVTENLTDLIKTVKDNKLCAGVAYDGDSDRVGAVDEQGQPIWGDMLLAIFARSILKDNPGATFIAEVKSSKNLFDDIKKHGGKAIMWKAGHSLIKQKMAETGALLSGEMSGHIFFKHRWFGFDDAIYASLRLAELLTASKEPLSAWLSDMPKVINTPEIRVDCPDDIKFKVVDKVAKHLSEKYEVVTVDGARVTFPDGWGLVRASNTQPALVMRFEAQTQQRLAEIQDLVEGEVKKAVNKI